MLKYTTLCVSITHSFCLIWLLAGRDYETRNYSFEEVHYHMAEQLAKVCSFTFAVIIHLLFALSRLKHFFLCACLLIDFYF